MQSQEFDVGVPIISIQWGAWMTGMAAENQVTLRRFERLGMGAIKPNEGLTALHRIISYSSIETPNVSTLSNAVLSSIPCHLSPDIFGKLS